MQTRVLILLLILSLTAGCGPAAVPPTPAPETFTPIPTLTALPPPSATATYAQPPYTPTLLQTLSADVVLRSGPSRLFDQIGSLPPVTNVLLIARSAGSEWLWVQIPSGKKGWVSAQFVNDEDVLNLEFVPAQEPSNAQVLLGRLLDVNGQPISGIGFAVTQGTASDSPRADAATDEAGYFHAYLPLSTSGQWRVVYVSVACTSIVMDSNCKCKTGLCGAPDPETLTITLPYNDVLTFVWR